MPSLNDPIGQRVEIFWLDRLWSDVTQNPRSEGGGGEVPQGDDEHAGTMSITLTVSILENEYIGNNEITIIIK